MRILVVAALFLIAVSPARAVEGVDCPEDSVRLPNGNLEPRFIVRIRGDKRDLLDVFENGVFIFGDQSEMRQSQGGTPPPSEWYLGCSDITIGNNGTMMTVTAGWRRDIVHAYKFIREGDRVVGIQRAIVRLRDGRVHLKIDGDDVLVTFGRKGDLRTRLCFGPRPGADKPPYGALEWGWFYGTPRTGNFPPCQGRLNTGASGRANWGQTFLTAGVRH